MDISADGAHVAVTTFSNAEFIEHPIHFKDHINLTSFIDAVDRSVKHTGGETDTIDGLNASLNNMFNESNGMRSNVQQVLFFMTDGRCSTNGYNCTPQYPQIRRDFDNRGIKIIGLGVTSKADAEEILMFVNRKNYRNITDFTTLFDPGLPRKLHICDGMLIICIDDIKWQSNIFQYLKCFLVMLWFHNLLRIYYYLVDCTWSGWQRWSKCDSVCGGGIRSRYRPVKFQSMGRGSKCKIKDRTEIEGCSKSLCTSTTSTTMITTPRSRYNLSRIDPSVCDHSCCL